jgi:hypothetical protein
VTERPNDTWLVGVVLGVLFVLLSFVDAVFLDGHLARDLVGIGLGALLAVVAYAKSRGWQGVRG